MLFTLLPYHSMAMSDVWHGSERQSHIHSRCFDPASHKPASFQTLHWWTNRACNTVGSSIHLLPFWRAQTTSLPPLREKNQCSYAFYSTVSEDKSSSRNLFGFVVFLLLLHYHNGAMSHCKGKIHDTNELCRRDDWEWRTTEVCKILKSVEIVCVNDNLAIQYED